jgi:hypothetical protein
VIDAFRSIFVFDDRDSLPLRLRQYAVQQSRLAGTQEAGEDGDGQQSRLHAEDLDAVKTGREV